MERESGEMREEEEGRGRKRRDSSVCVCVCVCCGQLHRLIYFPFPSSSTRSLAFTIMNA